MRINFLLNLTLQVKPENIKENHIYIFDIFYMSKTVGFITLSTRQTKPEGLLYLTSSFSGDKCWKMTLREISCLKIFNMENY